TLLAQEGASRVRPGCNRPITICDGESECISRIAIESRCRGCFLTVSFGPAMELRQIRYFVSVARHGSFTRAATDLRVVQPALSQQIKRTEKELTLQLFDRRGSTLALTPAGSAFLRRAETILADVNMAITEMRGFSEATTGRVAVGAMFTLNGGALNFPALF